MGMAAGLNGHQKRGIEELSSHNPCHTSMADHGVCNWRVLQPACPLEVRLVPSYCAVQKLARLGASYPRHTSVLRRFCKLTGAKQTK